MSPRLSLAGILGCLAVLDLHVFDLTCKGLGYAHTRCSAVACKILDWGCIMQSSMRVPSMLTMLLLLGAGISKKRGTGC